MDVDVHTLTNDELRYMLKRYGVEPGPIVGTTRRVYENKLVHLLQERGPPPVPPMEVADRSPPSTRLTPRGRDNSPIKNVSPIQSIFGFSPPTPVVDREEDRMEGEEQFRFVSPTFQSSRGLDPILDDDLNDFSSTQVRQRTSDFVRPSPRLYPDLRKDEVADRPWQPKSRLSDYGSDLGAGFSSSHRTTLSPRTATPRDVYGVGNGQKSATGLPVWLKIVLSLLVTIFIIMLFRRYSEESGDVLGDAEMKPVEPLNE